jgi:hypothetical protein
VEGGEENMSVFVKDRTINYIVNWLGRELEHAYGTIIIRQKLQEMGFAASEAGWTEKLGQAMFQLNIKAVDARYGCGEAVKFRQLDYRYEVTEPVPLVQVLKSLHCWLYRCNEGDVPETALYRLFDSDVQLYLMDTIITKLPEYAEAKWG